MSSHHRTQTTRPGGHSAKNAHRAGAPNTHLSGENLMVGNRCAVDTTAVIHIHDRLAALGTSRLLSVDAAGRCVRINLWSLAWQVRRILAEHTHELRSERAALWALLKDRVRAVITLAQENTALYLEWLDLSAEFARVRAERDELAEVSAQREDEIQALRFEVEQLLAGGGGR